MNFIYITTNIKNGKQYVGSHKGHINDSYLGSGKIIKDAIKKYGKENFKREILEICEIDKNLILETKYIKKYNTLVPNGYNILENGGHNIFTFETRKKLSNLKKGKPSPRKGVKLSDETKQKISEALKGKPGTKHTKDTIERIKKNNTGKIRSEETKQKLSNAHKGKKLSEETKKKMSDFQKSRIKSKEECINISKSKKGSKNPMYGKDPWNKGLNIPKSEKTKEKLRKKYKCIHCGFETNKSNLTRYHNENCKYKN